MVTSTEPTSWGKSLCILKSMGGLIRIYDKMNNVNSEYVIAHHKIQFVEVSLAGLQKHKEFQSPDIII